jgi:flavin-binding protein dodecin
MKNHPIYKLIEVVGTSTSSPDDAIKNAIEKTAKTIKNLDWFEVISTRGCLEKGKIKHYQVTMKIGFRIEDK